MKTTKHLLSILVCAALLAVPAARGANVTKLNNNTALDQGGSWTGGTGPTTSDVATWDNTVSTAANCTNTLALSTNWGGIEILNPSAPVQINNSGGTLFLGSSGIDLNEAGTSQSLFLNLPVNIFASQSWNVASGQVLTFGTSGVVSSNYTVTASGTINCTNGFSVSGGGTMVLNSGSITLMTNFSSLKGLNVGSDSSGGTLTQNGGAVNVSAAGGTSGSYVASMVIGGAGSAVGVYNLNGGTLSDTTSNKFGYCSPGNSTGAKGTLNINGGSASFYSLRIGNGNGSGFVNVTNGSLTVVTGEFSIGRGSTIGVGQDGTFSVYGGTVSAPGISVNLPKGVGPGVLNMNGGTFGIGSSLGVPAGSTGSGTLNMNAGVVNVTNNLNLPGGGTGAGTVNLNGGILAVSAVSTTGGGNSAFEFNGGVLRSRSSTQNFITNSALLTVHVDAGGAIIDTTNFTVAIPAVLQNGTGGGADGGLTKLGAGKLTLTAQNSYNGPTTVGAGTLALSTTNNYTIGALTVSNTATFDAVVAAAGTSLNCSTYSEGVNPGDAVTNQFDLGTFGNPTAPVVNATSLAANGNVSVYVNGSGFAIGTVQLIKYTGSVSGGGAFTLKFLAGAAGYVTNDTSAHSINLVITGFPNLTWRGPVNNNWDLATANWVDSNNVAQVYVDGATVNFNDVATNTSVILTNAFSPAAINLNNVVSNYVFSGAGGSLGGAGGLTKTGAGKVTMSLTNNSYTGNTVISNGVYQLGTANAIPGGSGRGNLTLEGKLDLAGFNESLNGLAGNNGVIDNSGGTAVVLTTGNNSGTGTFAGQITNSGASLALNNVGGSLTLLAANSYTGGTTNSGGTLQLASASSIGSGTLTLGGGTLSWTDALAHTLTNPVVMSGSVTLGSAGNGTLTIASTVNLNGGNRSITCTPNAILQNGATNGTITGKSGTGSLILRNTTADWNSGSLQVSQGALVLDGDNIIQDGNNIRVQCTVTNGLSDLVITNGAVFVLSNGPAANLRVGANDTSGAPGCTNVLDVAGILTVIPYPGTGDKLMMGGSSSGADAQEIVNLLSGGVLTVRQVTNTSLALTTFNFDGGTLKVSTNDIASDFFDLNILQVNVLDGGAFFDTAGFSGIMFKNDLLAGGSGIGSVTKNGTGQLILAGSGYATSTFGGATIVNAGTLTVNVPLPNTTNFTVAAGATLDVSGSSVELTSGKSIAGGGTVVGSVTVDSGALVLPGTPVATGTLTFNSAPSLSGTAVMKLSRGSSPNSDQIALSSGTLNYGGNLVVTNIGATPAPGDTFYLFSSPGGYSGAFSSVTLPTLPAGLGFTNNFLVDGSLTVTGAVANPTIPRFVSAVFTGNQLVLSGTNGQSSTQYRVLATTNLTVPVTNWPAIATNNFDGSGSFSFTNIFSPTNPAKFFRIVYP